MIIGNPLSFAIESDITQAYERPSLLALGFFAIHIGGRSYGVKTPDATMLANSFDTVRRRITERGHHNAPFLLGLSAAEIASAVSRALYSECKISDHFFGLPASEFSDSIYSSHLMWAPDGDEAFDDGSYVLHLDMGEEVRLIAFSRHTDPLYDVDSLREESLGADKFYGILHDWRAAFEEEWRRLPKT